MLSNPKFYGVPAIISVFGVFLLAAGVTAASHHDRKTATPAAPSAIRSRHVFLLLEENESYSDVVGNPAMPYFNSLLRRAGLAANFYANTHPSIGNYLELLSGQIITNQDGFSGVVSANNIIREMIDAGKTWKSYAEGLPQAGYTGEYWGKDYLRRHDPASFLSDVVNNPVEAKNIVPFSQFSADLRNNSFPQFAFIAPNGIDDGHQCDYKPCPNSVRLRNTDAWLKKQLPPLLSSPAFQDGGLLIITWDEAGHRDNRHGGGHIPTLLVGAHIRRGYRSAYFYQEQNVLRTICEACGLPRCPGDGAQAAAMTDFFAR
jgi:phosphatidylinositol-3-phosphatase